MTDPDRWTDDDAPMAVRELLSAAREEEPGRAGMERTLVAVGVGGVVVTGSAHAAGAIAGATAAKTVSGAGTLLVVAKWGGIGALAAVGTLGTALTVGALREVSPPPAPHFASASTGASRAVTAQGSRPPSRASESPLSEPAAAPVAVVPDEPVAAHLANPAGPRALAPQEARAASLGEASVEETGPGAEPPTPRMLDEVRAIDRAREALVRGDSPSVIQAVGAYFTDFPERRFAPEAFFLEMEARSRLGDAAGARAIAERLVAAYPRAPQAARARLVLSSAR